MFDDLRIMRPQAWLDWQLMEENNGEWCVMRGNFKTQEYKPVKNLYVRMQISRFIKQGYTFIESGNEHTLAALSPSGKEVVVAVLNTTERERSFNIDLNKFSGKITAVSNWRTSETEDCQPFPAVSFKGKKQTYVSPARSLTTFVLTIDN